MRADIFQKTAKKLLPFAVIFGLILILTYGFPVTGSDWSSLARDQGLNFSTAAQFASDSGGSYLAGFLTGLFGGHDLLRHVVTGTAIFGVFLALVRFCKLKSVYTYFMAACLCIAMPSAIYAQTYAWVSGSFEVLIPACLNLLYLSKAASLLEGKRKSKMWTVLPMCVMGFAAQLFSESMGIGLCLLSASIFTVYYKKKGLSWHLAAHLIGAVLGCVLTWIVPGGLYFLRDMGDIFTNAAVIIDGVFADNWLVTVPLTLSCLLLIQPIRSERSKRCNQTLWCLLFPTLVFAVCTLVLDKLTAHTILLYFSCAAKFVASILYLIGVGRTARNYISKEATRSKVYLCIAGIAVFCLPLLFGSAPDANALYLPYLLLVCMTMILACYALHRYSRLEKFLRKPLAVLSCGILLCFLWISAFNGYTQDVRIEYTQDQMRQGAQEICLPDYPYGDYVWDASSDSIQSYYYYETPGDISFTFTSYEDWDWGEYYAKRSSKFEDEFEEDGESPSDKDEIKQDKE